MPVPLSCLSSGMGTDAEEPELNLSIPKFSVWRSQAYRTSLQQSGSVRKNDECIMRSTSTGSSVATLPALCKSEHRTSFITYIDLKTSRRSKHLEEGPVLQTSRAQPLSRSFERGQRGWRDLSDESIRTDPQNRSAVSSVEGPGERQSWCDGFPTFTCPKDFECRI